MSDETYIWRVTGNYRLWENLELDRDEFEVFVTSRTIDGAIEVVRSKYREASIWTISRGSEVIS